MLHYPFSFWYARTAGVVPLVCCAVQRARQMLVWVSLWTLLVLVAGVAGLGVAHAQSQRNSAGDYDILQATYGTGRQAMDVTMRVRQWVQAGRGFRVSNDAFGADPAPGQPKLLRIEARGPDGRARHFDYPESQWVDARLFQSDPAVPYRNPAFGGGNGDGDVYNRDSEPYRHRDGGRHRAHANQIVQATYGTRWQSVDVTFRVSQLIEQGERGFIVSNEVFGADPAPGHRKVLNVQMRDNNGRLHSLDFAESAWVDAAQLAGSGRGAGNDGRWREDSRHNGLVIHRAVYGDGTRYVDVTQRVRDAVSHGSLDVFVNNELAGYDPAPYVRKRLQVEYSVGNSRWTRQAVTAESQRLRLP